MKKNNIVHILLLAVLCIGQAPVVHADAEQPSNQNKAEVKTDDHRATKRYGAYLGILGDPHPTVVGVNIAYNVLDYLRASIGFGKISVSSIGSSSDGFAVEDTSITTIGAAAKFLVPGWNLSPSATLGYSHLSFGGLLADSDYKTNNIYFGAGGDWQSETGFNVGVGLNVSMNGAAPTAPYLNLGMFF